MDAPAPLREALADRYRIVRAIGQGGMATVYLAEDVRHEREVALKVLRPELAAVVGGERFVAEIRTTANLQHPHILPLFDSGESEGFLWFVTPYVAGESLADRFDRVKQLPVDEAVDLAVKVAGALQAAHDRGIVHRDVKPGNILLTEAGEPLVADFGIALAVQEAGGGRLTETGLSLGTPWYMSPEQALADRDPDARSDVYSLGCVLYQALTGEPPFQGGTAQAVLGRILTGEPDPPTHLRRSVPPGVEAAVLRALEKTPADRFPSARAFAAALQDPEFRHLAAPTAGAPARRPPEASGAPPSSPARALPWLAAAAFAGVAAWGWLRTAPAPDAAPASLALPIPAALDSSSGAAISPDGRTFVVVPGNDHPIHVRTLADPTWRPLPGTENGRGWSSFSPDGESLAYTTDDGALMQVRLDGGTPLTVLEPGAGDDLFEPHWGADGSIVFVRERGIFRIPAGGGPVDTFQIGINAADPHLLPDGSGILFGYLGPGTIGYLDTATDSAWVVIEGGTTPWYLESGHVLFGRAGGTGLRAVAFDLGARRAVGDPVPLVDDVPSREWAISRTGTLMYDPTPDDLQGSQPTVRFVRTDADGRVVDTLPLAPTPVQAIRLSPDGSRLAYSGYIGGGEWPQLFVYDIARQEGPRQVSDERGVFPSPVWSPDGDTLLYSASTAGNGDLRIRHWRGGEARDVLGRPRSLWVSDWTGDGWIVGGEERESDADDLLLFRADAPGDARPFVQTPLQESDGRVSPDGRWLAYAVTGRDGAVDIEVRTFPEGLRPRRIMSGLAPTWSPDGRRLYGAHVVTGLPDDTLKVVDLNDEGAPTGPPRALRTLDFWGLDVFPDGTLLLAEGVDPATLINRSPEATGRIVVLDWLATVRGRLGR